MIIANWEKETPGEVEREIEIANAQLKQACGCINYIMIRNDDDNDDDPSVNIKPLQHENWKWRIFYTWIMW